MIRPHFPFCGFTEDPVPIIKGLVDALEILYTDKATFATEEWYRYLNCGYRVAVVGGTDKMSAEMALGRLRTYACLAPDKPFSYESWSEAVRAGRTVTTNGPLIRLAVEGQTIGDTISMPKGGGTVDVEAEATSFLPPIHVLTQTALRVC